MRVLFDAFWILHGPPSGRNVLRSFVRGWVSTFPADVVEVSMPARDIDAVKGQAVVGAGVNHLSVAGRPHGISNLFFLDSKGHDVVVAQNFAPKRRGAKNVVFFHDVIFVRHPEWFTSMERVYLALAARSLRRADLILTSSSSEAAHIRKYLGPKNRTRVLPVGLALSEDFRTADPIAPAGFNPQSNYLLVVGRLNVRKNVSFIVKNLIESGTISKSFPLVVVGAANGKGGASKALDDAAREGSVTFVGHVSDAELKWLYSNTKLFIFPSLDEGFGLPILEAHVSGAPMVLSDIPAFKELAPGAIYFDPTDALSAADAIRRGLSSSADTEIDTQRWSWEATVSRSRSAIEELS